MTTTTARILGRTAAFVLRIYARLYRTVATGMDAVEERRRRGEPIVFALWHGEMFASILFHRHDRVVTMASRSADGEVISTMLGAFGYAVARGSTGKGGSRALEGMVSAITIDRCDGALTVDGPRGPAHVVQPGVVRLARLTKAWIVPIGSACRRGHRFASWDRYLVPLPFDCAWVAHGEPFRLDDAWSDDEASRRVAEAISRASEEASTLAGGRDDRAGVTP